MEALNAHILDQFGLGTLFLITLVLLTLFIELGFRLGRSQNKTVKAQASQVRAIMGASLGLLAFMMAFTFATSQSHYEARVAGMVEETHLVNNAFLQAESLREPYRSEARALLREYIAGRLEMDEWIKRQEYRGLFDLIERAEEIHLELWTLATEHGRAARDSASSGSRADAFMTSVIGIIDIHVARLQAAMMNRDATGAVIVGRTIARATPTAHAAISRGAQITA